MSQSTVLLVVDVQNGFVNEHTEHVLEPIKRLVEKWETEKKGPVIYSRFINLPGSPWEKLMDWRQLMNEPETSLHPDLSQNTPYIFKKSTYSAWSPEVQQVAHGANAQTIVLCGIDTDQCVLKTAIDIFEADITPVLVKDCCASSAGTDFHDMGIKLLERLIGRDQIKTSDEL